MGKEIFPGRYTAGIKEDVVVFIIGMRMNKWWAVHRVKLPSVEVFPTEC